MTERHKIREGVSDFLILSPILGGLALATVWAWGNVKDIGEDAKWAHELLTDGEASGSMPNLMSSKIVDCFAQDPTTGLERIGFQHEGTYDVYYSFLNEAEDSTNLQTCMNDAGLGNVTLIEYEAQTEGVLTERQLVDPITVFEPFIESIGDIFGDLQTPQQED